MVRAERERVVSCHLSGVNVDNSIGSLAQLADAMWFGDAISNHVACQCIDPFKVYIIGRHIMASNRTVFLTFSNLWKLLNIFRSLASGFDVQLLGDVTAKASTAALNKLGFGVNMLGNRVAPFSFTLIQAETESSAAYLQRDQECCPLRHLVANLLEHGLQACKSQASTKKKLCYAV